jgi:hypothetical protein
MQKWAAEEGSLTISCGVYRRIERYATRLEF